MDADRVRNQRGPTRERRQDALDHGLENGRDPGHDKDVGDTKARCCTDRVLDQAGTVGNACHAQAGGVHRRSGAVIMRLKDRAGIVAHIDRNTKRRGNTIGRNIVVRRPDAARGEEVVMGHAQRVHGLHDGGFVVGDDSHLAQVDPHAGQPPRQMMHVRLARASGKNLIPDHKHRRRGIGLGHGGLLLCVSVGYKTRPCALPDLSSPHDCFDATSGSSRTCRWKRMAARSRCIAPIRGR